MSILLILLGCTAVSAFGVLVSRLWTPLWLAPPPPGLLLIRAGIGALGGAWGIICGAVAVFRLVRDHARLSPAVLEFTTARCVRSAVVVGLVCQVLVWALALLS